MAKLAIVSEHLELFRRALGCSGHEVRAAHRALTSATYESAPDRAITIYCDEPLRGGAFQSHFERIPVKLDCRPNHLISRARSYPISRPTPRPGGAGERYRFQRAPVPKSGAHFPKLPATSVIQSAVRAPCEHLVDEVR